MFLENKSVINSLEGDLLNKSYSHAYLFSGSKGIGKFSHAKNFARSILNEDPEGIDDFEDADLYVVQKKDTIKKQDIEEIIENSFAKPFSGSHKIVIIDDFDRVTAEGQNALLKTLEEPMDYLVLILISSNMRNILPTIISRCRILKFQDLTQDRIEEFLLSRKVSPRNAKLFSRLSNGDVSLAIKYSEDPELLSKREDIINMTDRVIRQTEFIFDEMKFFKDNKDDFKEILNFMIVWYLDLVYVKSGREDLVVNIDKLDLLKLQDLSIDRAVESYDALINALGRKEKNVNFDLNIEKLLIDLGGIR